MRRLLFLIADTGGGHRAAATAVDRQMADTAPGQFEITILDPFSAARQRLIAGTADLYGPITRYARWLWGGLYHATNNRPAVRLLEATVLRTVTGAVADAIQRLDPDCVVSFHPLLNHVSVRAVRGHTRSVPVITVITDLVDIHAAWVCPDVDAVVVPSPGGFERCRRAGIAASRCHDLGLAVDRRFTNLPSDPAERSALRRRLGLRPESFVVLVCSGADGSGGIVRNARAIAASGIDLDLVVICGRNQRARKALSGLRTGGGREARVLGYVTDMPDWMRASDVVVTKAGPGTIAESLCCGLPLLLVWYLPGQERGNVEWVVDIGAGRYVPHVTQLVDAVAELAVPGSETLAAMRAAVRAAARPDATRRIAGLIASMAAGARG
ncbi:MAG TPA: glycosyltransferase [Candidatus Dormibacteraeota bacterium]|jgi:1,2-diacylglycerol 3-beta-galactosyltransferase